MHTFSLPFGKEKIKFELPEEQVAGVLVSHAHEYKAPKSEAELVADALANPIGSPKLSELAKGKKNCVIISSDHTRPVPSHIIMPQLLAELRKGNPDIDITILIATGMHRATTKEELIDRLVNFSGEPQKLELPSAPKHFIQYLADDNRPQVSMDVDYEKGMGVSIGRLRKDNIFDWKFVGLSHNTLRGAAGGAVECAEMLKALGYIVRK